MNAYDDLKPVLPFIWPEVMGRMSSLAGPVFSSSPEQVELLLTMNLNEYNFLTLEEKINILMFMIDAAYHLEVIKNYISNKMEDSNNHHK